jgi:hypothetical protein
MCQKKGIPAVGLSADDRHDERIVVEKSRPRFLGSKWMERENKVFTWRIPERIVLLAAGDVGMGYGRQATATAPPGGAADEV